MTDSSETDAFLRLLAERAAADHVYLGWALRAYAQAEGQSLADVLAQLKIAETYVTDFLVSLRPSGERFAEMVRAISARFGSDETALLAVLREVEVLQALRAGASADTGLLMAARMREEGARPRGAAENTETYRNDESRKDDSHRPGDDEAGDAR